MFDWISGFLASVGLPGVALLMFLENVFPPIPSELIMPLAGYNAAVAGRSLVAVVAAGSVGSMAGAVFWYWIGRSIGAERLKRLAARHGRWLTISPGDVDGSAAWFERYGARAVLFARLIPTVRTFISVPAGLVGMPFGRFLGFTAIGTVAWTGLLTLAGGWLQSEYTRVSGWLNPVSTGVVVILVAVYLWRVATFGRHTDTEPPPPRS